MNLNFAEVIAALGADGGAALANASLPPTRFLFAELLPERNLPSFHVQSSTMIVRTTMAGLTGMDSSFPPGGAMDGSNFSENTAKIAIESMLNEEALRTIREFLVARAGGADVSANKEFLANEALNFLQKVVVQALHDRSEWLRGQCLSMGKIDWTFNGKRLLVDYLVPSANYLPNRTGTAAYSGSASAFWSDVRLLQSALNYDVRAYMASSALINDIISNPVNNINLVQQSNAGVTIQKFRGTLERDSTDSRDLITLIRYDEQGEIYDLANPGKTVKLAFLPRTKLLAVGNNQATGFRVGQGATVDPSINNELGYTHVAPTIEGGVPGQWAELYTPERRPYQLNGRGVKNLLPVLEAPEKVAAASSDLSA